MPQRDSSTSDSPGPIDADGARLDALAGALPLDIRLGTSSWNYPGGRGRHEHRLAPADQRDKGGRRGRPLRAVGAEALHDARC